MSDSYAAQYQAVFVILYGNDQPAGVGAQQLASAEAALGRPLPEALQQFYARVGGERRVMATHNRVLPPDELWINTGRLVFCDENQSVCQWGVGLGEDPVVEQGVSAREAREWYSEELTCSQFLMVLMYLQAAWGGYEHAGHCADASIVLPVLETEWVQRVNHNGLRIFQRDGLLISHLAGDASLAGAGREGADIERLCAELPFTVA